MALKYCRPLYYVEIYIVGYREYATDGESQSCLPLKENTILGEGTGHFWHSLSLLLLFLLNKFVLCKMSSSVYIQKLNEGNITIWIIQIQLSRSHFIVLVSICLVYDFFKIKPWHYICFTHQNLSFKFILRRWELFASTYLVKLL